MTLKEAKIRLSIEHSKSLVLVDYDFNRKTVALGNLNQYLAI